MLSAIYTYSALVVVFATVYLAVWVASHHFGYTKFNLKHEFEWTVAWALLFACSWFSLLLLSFEKNVTGGFVLLVLFATELSLASTLVRTFFPKEGFQE